MASSICYTYVGTKGASVSLPTGLLLKQVCFRVLALALAFAPDLGPVPVQQAGHLMNALTTVLDYHYTFQHHKYHFWVCSLTS